MKERLPAASCRPPRNCGICQEVASVLPVLSLSPIVEGSVIGVPSPTPARGLWSGRAQGRVKDEPGPRPTRIPVPPRVQPCLPSPPGQALPTWYPRSGPRPPPRLPPPGSSMATRAPGALGSRCPECASSLTGHSGLGESLHPEDGETEAPGKLTCPGMLSWEWRRDRARPPPRATRLPAPVFEPAAALCHFSVFCFG